MEVDGGRSHFVVLPDACAKGHGGGAGGPGDGEQHREEREDGCEKAHGCSGDGGIARRGGLYIVCADRCGTVHKYEAGRADPYQ